MVLLGEVQVYSCCCVVWDQIQVLDVDSLLATDFGVGVRKDLLLLLLSFLLLELLQVPRLRVLWYLFLLLLILALFSTAR